MSQVKLRWRKFSPIDRESPIYELLDGEVVVLDIGKGTDQRLEIAFHEGASGRVFDLATLEQLISEGKRLLEQDD